MDKQDAKLLTYLYRDKHTALISALHNYSKHKEVMPPQTLIHHLVDYVFMLQATHVGGTISASFGGDLCS